MSCAAKVHYLENVWVCRTEHRSLCRLVQDAHLTLPESLCDCGATDARLSKEIRRGHNIVTDAGDVFYGEVIQEGINSAFALGATITPTDAFASCYVATAFGTPAKSSTSAIVTTAATSPEQAVDSGYPIVDDNDADNGGAGTDILTWRFSYGTAGGVGTLVGLIIGAASLSFPGTDPILTASQEADWTPSGSVSKTSSDTLKIFVNHRLNGVAP